MKYLLIPLLCFLAVTKITIQTGFSKKSGSDDNGIFFNGLAFLIASLIFLPSLIKNGAEFDTLVSGCIMGTLSFLFQFFYIKALKIGKMSLTVIINNFSMLIPITVSVLFLDESFGATKIIGTVLALIAVTLTAKKNRNEDNLNEKQKFRFKWFLYIGIVFLCNGFISVDQKLYAAGTEKLQATEFVAVAYITAFLISAAALGAKQVGKRRMKLEIVPSVVASACSVGAILAVFQVLNTYSASVIDGTILYSVYNCGVSMLSIICGRLLFKEKLSYAQAVGTAVGIVSIVFLCI